MKTFCLRRVYESYRCSISDADTSMWKGFSQAFGDITMEVGVNYAPKPGLPLPITNGRDIVRGQENRLEIGLHVSIEGTAVAGPITEFVCWVDDQAEITDELRARCRLAIDLFAVAVGASVSPQLLGTELGEDEWRRLPDGRWTCQVGRQRTLIEEPNPTQDEVRTQTLDWVTGKPLNPHVVDRGVLGWLVRAWRERDLTSAFLAYFIPLEMLLAGYKAESGVSAADIEAIKTAVAAECGDDADRLVRLVDSMGHRMGPSLAQRFDVMARKVSRETAEVDSTAFRKFNRMRNALVHRGDRDLRTVVKVGMEDVVHLRVLTERYIVGSLFQCSEPE